MATQIKHRRGTTSEHSTFTGSEAEITVDTTKDTLIVHDGSTAGGHELAKADGSNIAFGDNVKAKFGAGDDLQIYHDGNDSYIADVGTGGLVLRAANNIKLLSDTGELYFQGIKDGASKVYYNGAEVLKTTSTGIDVTGTVTADAVETDTIANESTGTTTTSTTQTAIATFAKADYDSAKVVISAKSGTDVYSTELLIVHNGTTASATEYGQIGTGSALATFDVDISGADVRVLATAASSTSTVFKVTKTLL